jgi:deoxycytidylate deaminase
MQAAPGTPSSTPSELVLGLVAPVGVDLDGFVQRLREHLQAFGYHGRQVRLSDFLRRIEIPGEIPPPDAPEAERLERLMDRGNRLREATNRNDVLALAAAAEIARHRRANEPLSRTAHILRSLKHPDEVMTLRQIYREGFFLIGVFAKEAERIQTLVHSRSMSLEDARARVARDQDEALPHGQHTRDAFQAADVFIRQPSRTNDHDLLRFLELVFGHPFHTPTADEHAMYLAYAASLRSGSLSRQVGAVVVSRHRDILSVGANDVPRFSGGLYWPGDGDQRDYVRGLDSNDREKERIVEDLIDRLLPLDLGGVSSVPGHQDRFTRALDGSKLLDITEYGRDVHAEMEALLACARNGVSPRGGTLYATTFPCHNCAKHIVVAGITRVVFIEPYAKSRALDLHDDSIALEEARKDQVLFEPFIGVGPGRYLDLFSLRLGAGGRKHRKARGRAVFWSRESAVPFVPLKTTNYVENESQAQETLATLLDALGEKGEGSW